jgi:pyruvate,water dikinase
MTLVWTPKDSPIDESHIGGKAANLARLAALGLRVPAFFVVTTDAHARGVEAAIGDIRAAHARVIPAGAFVAVRSSAVGEDAADASFAGLHETLLFIRGEEALLDAIRHVQASARSERALTYRRERGLPAEARIAVVVQEMIESRTSGVVFTANPTTGNVQEIVISALFGLGEGLVGEGFDADTFTVAKDDLAIQSEIAEKTEAIVFDRDRGTGTRTVTVEDPKARSIGDEGVRQLARVSLDIERAFGRPQDIEFAFDEAGLAILQTRPITTVEEFGPAAGNARIWDNSNIVESFAGITSPMTFSVIRRAYTIVYKCFSEVMGIHPDVVQENRLVFENMLGLFRGNVYYNLLNWYAAIRLFPGFEYNRSFMESMMGVKESTRFSDAPSQPLSWRQRYFVELPALFRLLTRSLLNFARVRKLGDEFLRNFHEHYDRWSKLDYRKLTPHELMLQYDQFEQRVLWHWRAPIINDFFVMIFYGLLKKLAAKWCGDASGSLQNDLLTGEGGIESAEPAKELLRLAAIAKRDAPLRAALESDMALHLLRSDARFAEFQSAIERYLELYGFRCMNELKLEELTLRDRPEVLITYIRNYLNAPDEQLDLAAREANEQRMRADAERRAMAGLSMFKRPIFRFVLRCARLGVKNRENMRFARTRIFGLVREVVRGMGHQLFAEKLIDAPEDVFYLGLEELWDFVKGTALTTDLRGLVALRKAEWDRYRAEEPPDERFETFGMAYHRNRFKGRAVVVEAHADGLLHGTACSPGKLTCSVRVLKSPDGDLRLNGEILVAARTDPGWVPLYPSISGLIIERGSILSHSAIVAREMGIPTIVGIRGITELLKDGDRVTMDGGAGTVEIHKE